VSAKEQALKLKLWGESLRDIGILLLVFGPLDALLHTGHITGKQWGFGIGSMIAGALMLWGGVEIESKYGL